MTSFYLIDVDELLINIIIQSNSSRSPQGQYSQMTLFSTQLRFKYPSKYHENILNIGILLLLL